MDNSRDEIDLDEPRYPEGVEAPDFAVEYEPEPTWRRLLRGTLSVVLVALVLGGIRLAGERFYEPASRIPSQPAYPLASGLMGATMPVLAALERAEVFAAEVDAAALAPVGEVYRLPFPRTLADRAFGRREERALVFSLSDANGNERRFLALLGEGAPLFAIEPTASRLGDRPDGAFIALPAGAGSPFGPLLEALTQLVDALQASDVVQLSADDYTVFGPYGGMESERVTQDLQANVVVSHLARELADADVSLEAPVFEIRQAPQKGFVRGSYTPGAGLIQRPLWETPSTSTLAHELLHAYLDRVAQEPGETRRTAANYFEEAHPKLQDGIVGELYSGLGRLAKAEEMLAFLTGAIAARQTRTVATSELLENQGRLSLTEPVLKTDVELLVELGVLPGCMLPAELGFSEAVISFAYYEAVETVCAPATSLTQPAVLSHT